VSLIINYFYFINKHYNIYARVKKPTVIETVKLNRLRWFGHVQRMEEIRIPKRVLPYFLAHKTHSEFFIRNFRKNNECILILVNCWKKTGLLHTKISNHNRMMPDLMIWKQISLSHNKDV
jgi:hypothetical protein